VCVNRGWTERTKGQGITRASAELDGKLGTLNATSILHLTSSECDFRDEPLWLQSAYICTFGLETISPKVLCSYFGLSSAATVSVWIRVSGDTCVGS
jgi:hypothetical protein